MTNHKKPLGKSIAFGCIVFTTLLCLTLSALNFFNLRNALYQRYQSYISDILRYVEKHIDHEDLKNCIETGVESETYKETLLFMDGIMDNFDIHYLYAGKPLNLNDRGNYMSVFCAEDYFNRYVDTEGNLYLGWISDDEYDAETIKELFDIMEREDISFFVEKTEWSTDYTGALALRGEDGEAYAFLAVDVDITTLSEKLWTQALENTAVILVLGSLFTFLFLLWARKSISNPIRMLEKGVVAYAKNSHGQHDLNALKFNAPVIRTDNEVKSLSAAITKMTEDMQDYVSEILSAEEKTRNMKELADEMSELAIIDSLTGLWNKTAFNREAEKLNQEISEQKNPHFGLAMVDLNFLKRINDTFGHEKGDKALRSLARITRTIFSFSSVYRVGGDELIVVLQGQDYVKNEALKSVFIANTARTYIPEEPWKHVSAAIGIALFDPKVDNCTQDVLERADRAMYAMKKEMKAERSD
ncbi:MAG: GGDEF domain-containing protein [Lachnospiraceae bacterium]|nr:GGDEF domain-containing protein [Lachnospiraceae bacterium]